MESLQLKFTKYCKCMLNLLSEAFLWLSKHTLYVYIQIVWFKMYHMLNMHL